VSVIVLSHTNEILTVPRSEQFGVPISFLQQQAYWLYEHELEQLRSEIQKGVQSAETITEESKDAPSSHKSDEKAQDKTITEDAVSEELSASTKSFNVFENQPRPLRHVPKFLNLEPETPKLVNPVVGSYSNPDAFQEYSNSNSDSDSDSDSSIDNFNRESVFLHRSKILSKPPPTFNDSDDDDEEEEEEEKEETEVSQKFQSIALNGDSPDSKTNKAKTATESSLSNLSCMYLCLCYLVFYKMYGLTNNSFSFQC